MIDELSPLDKVGVAVILGWSSPNHVDVNQHRTRTGKAAVPFPAPLNPDAPVAEHRWARADIDAYRLARAHKGRRQLEITPSLIAEIKEMYGKGTSLDEIAEIVGVSRSTVWRIATDRRPVDTDTAAKTVKAVKPPNANPLRQSRPGRQREKPITEAEMAQLFDKPPRKRTK